MFKFLWITIMKKSKSVKLGLLTVIAATILACNNSAQTYSQCVDGSGNVVAESQCTSHIPGYVYYFSPSPFYYGSRVYGGGYVSHSTNITNVYHSSPSSNSGVSRSNVSGSTVTSSPVSRGGFGSTGSSSGSSGS